MVSTKEKYNKTGTAKRRDEALRRAFQMPHKPHETLKKKRKPTAGKGRVRVGKSRA
jgi:hypothetical protein